MFNPFIQLTDELLKTFRAKKYFWLVSQTFNCTEAVAIDKQGLLFTPYNDPGFAADHLKAQKADKFSRILELENEVHRNKLAEMINPESRYSLWVSIVKDKTQAENRMVSRYQKNIRRYITSHTGWRIKGDSTLATKMDVQYGEVYITLKYSHREEIRLRIEELAKS